MIPTMETRHLILRPLRETDFADYFEYAQDPEVASTGMWQVYESREAAYEDFMRLLSFYPRGFMWWALEARIDGKMIGRCQIGDYDEEDLRCDISYALHRDYWGRGYVSEAAERVAAFAFDELGVNRISATVFPDNIPSVRILKKLGMKLEGVLRQYRSVRGAPEDVHLYSVLRQEWEQMWHP